MPEGVGKRCSRRRLEFRSHPSGSLRAFLMRDNPSTLKADRAKPGWKASKVAAGNPLNHPLFVRRGRR